MRCLPLVVLLAAVAALVTPTPAPAYRGEHGDMHRFHEHDFVRWRRGRWIHGHHEGRFGWWWTVGGVWYWYPRPVYPYPDPYTPPVIVQVPAAPYPDPYTPPVIVQVPAAPVAPAAQPQAQAPVWYYCGQPAGYYPYVPACPGGWQTVPATPPPAPAAEPPPPSGPRR